MNKVFLMGRLTRDPDIRYSQGEKATCIARYTLAVDRRFKREGEQNADFISCVAFGKSGEFVEKYLHKGIKIAIAGRIQTGSYEKDGQRVYTTDVVVEEHEFAESKSSASSGAGNTYAGTATAPAARPAEGPAGYDGFMNIPDGIDEELPFT
jgi:single-strand DNA-binding protein